MGWHKVPERIINKENDLGMGRWGPEIPFLERIEKPVRKNGPPLTAQEVLC